MKEPINLKDRNGKEIHEGSNLLLIHTAVHAIL
jgi:hypothetical protein